MSNRKLTKKDVLLIRQLGEERDRVIAELRILKKQRKELTLTALAKKFEVDYTTIRSVINYTNYRYLK